MKNERTINILFLNSLPTRPKTSTAYRRQFEFLSHCFQGAIITPVSRAEHLSVKKIGKFEFIAFVSPVRNAILRNIFTFYFLLSRGLERFYFGNQKFEVVLSPNPFTAGLVAILLGKLTGAKVVIELNGNFGAAFKYGARGEISPNFVMRLKEKIGKILIRFVLKRADNIKTLYCTQLNDLGINGEMKLTSNSFADFVLTSEFLKKKRSDQKYILFLGHPWYLKGVDILIEAFNKISDQFPEYHLKIVGWCPEGRDFYEKLRNGNPRIEFHDPVLFDQVSELMSQCTFFVLPSRTEAMGRVLLEAMAAGKPVIASCVDGIPSVVEDGINGLLFEKENIQELANKMRILLTDSKLYKNLVVNGLKLAREKYSENEYVNNYSRLIKDVLEKKGKN